MESTPPDTAKTTVLASSQAGHDSSWALTSRINFSI